MVHEGIDQDLLMLLVKVLRFNPLDRMSTREIIEDAVFDGVRKEQVKASCPVEIHVDELPFNGKTGKHQDYSVKKIKQYVIKLGKKILKQ